MSVDVGVVIPSRNRWPLLRTAIAGALAQEHVDVQIIVVDDGSTDCTPHELAAVTDSRVQVLRLAAQEGVSTARNLGLERVTAEWVAFLDDDDVWAPGHLAAMLDAARISELDPERVGLVFSGHLDVDRARCLIGVSHAESASDVLQGFREGVNLIGGPSRVVLRTDAVREAGGFDTRLSTLADWDLWVRVAALWEVVRCPDLLVAYMHHAGNMHQDVDLFLSELAVLQESHGRDLRRRESLTGSRIPFCVAEVYRSGGRRICAARWYVESFRARGDRRDLGRAAGVLLGERVIEMSRLSNRRVPDPSVGHWLWQVREGEYATPRGLPTVTSTQPDSQIAGNVLR